MRTVLASILGVFVALISLTAYAESEAELMKQADGMYAKRATKGQADEAVKVYQKILAINPENVAAYWKISRALYWIGRTTKGNDKQATIYKDGIEYCKLAMELDPKSAPAMFWLAVMYGKYGETKGVMQSLHLVPHMEKLLKQLIKADPKLEDGGGYRVYGRLKFKLPGFKGGSNTEAIDMLKKAIEVGPNNLMNYRYLAEVYMAEGKDAEAKEMLQKVIDMPGPAKLKPESAIEKKEAKKLLEKLGG